MGGELSIVGEQRLRIESEALTVEVETAGGAILSAATRDGRPVLSNGSAVGSADRTVCFPMVPVCNRVEGNAFSFRGKTYRLAPNADDPLYVHGDGWLGAWRDTGHEADEVRLMFDKEVADGGPFAYRAEQTIRVDGTRLELRLGVTNRAAEPMPFGLGFHPYFPRTAQTTLHAAASDWWTEGEGSLPSVRRPISGEVDFSKARRLPESRLNNGFEGWEGQARILWPENGLGADVAASSNLGRYMIYAPTETPDFFCFEPMSHTPNALAHADDDLAGLRVLAPGERLEVSMTISVFEAQG
ncbi:MAG: aldose 1-epimerase [Rhizobiaceae bacterium]